MNEYRRQLEENGSQNENIKKKMQQILQENQNLNDEVRNAQENLRLSANQISKLSNEINEYRSRMDINNQESETYRRKIQNLVSENTNLGDEIKTAQ